jgi:HEAT repeat protein
MQPRWLFPCAVLVITAGRLAANADQPAEIERLIRQLGSSQFAEREAASARLKVIGEPAANALRKAADGADAEIRWRAEALLDALGGGRAAIEQKSLLEWSKLLANGDGELRRKAATALAKAGPRARAELPALRRALSDNDVSVRWRVAYALWKIDPKLGKESLAAIKQAGRELEDRLPSLGSPDDVAETRAMLFAALEIADGRSNR